MARPSALDRDRARRMPLAERKARTAAALDVLRKTAALARGEDVSFLPDAPDPAPRPERDGEPPELPF